MKQIPFLSIILALCMPGAVNAQAKKPAKTVKYDTIIVKRVDKPLAKPVVKKELVLPVPEYINQPYYYDKEDNKLTKLENAQASLLTKKKTLGLKGAKQSLEMNDPSSRIWFTAKKDISFFLKTSGDVIDVTSYIKLYRFVPVDQKREVTLSSKEGLLANKDEGRGELIAFGVKQLSKDNYVIQLQDQLAAGEYGFVWVKNMDQKEFIVFAFGIDWKSSD